MALMVVLGHTILEWLIAALVTTLLLAGGVVALRALLTLLPEDEGDRDGMDGSSSLPDRARLRTTPVPATASTGVRDVRASEPGVADRPWTPPTLSAPAATGLAGDRVSRPALPAAPARGRRRRYRTGDWRGDWRVRFDREPPESLLSSRRRGSAGNFEDLNAEVIGEGDKKRT